MAENVITTDKSGENCFVSNGNDVKQQETCLVTMFKSVFKENVNVSHEHSLKPEEKVDENRPDATMEEKQSVKTEKIPCDDCGRPFTKRYMPIHRRSHQVRATRRRKTRTVCREPKRYKEDDDSESLTSSDGESNDEKRRKAEKYLCYVCDRAFAKHEMETHLRTHRKSKFRVENDLQEDVKCDDDDEDGRLEEDREESEAENGFDGELRGNLTSKVYVKNSKRRVKFPCDVCGGLYTKYYMREHMRTHTGEKPHACNDCDKQFATAGALKLHVEICHSDERGKFKCELCSGTYTSRVGLKQHVLTHTDEKRFQCEICGKAFKLSGQLNAHVKTHNDGMPYQCEACGRRYKSYHGLRRHRIRDHQGIRPTYPCTLCERVFTQAATLKDHLNRHEGTTPYVCKYCGKALLSRKILRGHMMIHEDKKPYECHVCRKTFRQKNVLTRHMSVHTGIKPFSCEQCGKQFIHRVYLVKHTCELQTM